MTFTVDESDPEDAYARLYAPAVVETIGQLALPRYGLGNYINDKTRGGATPGEKELLQNLGRAGKRLIGFSRTGLFKRLESGGFTFVQSLERHVLRNYVFLHALEAGQPLPIGPQNAELLDERDDDEDTLFTAEGDVTTPEESADTVVGEADTDVLARTEAAYRARAAQVYAQYETRYKRRFKWIRSELFTKKLATALRQDARALLGVLNAAGEWHPANDPKLNALHTLLTTTHPDEKVLVFTQFADTVQYLVTELKQAGRDPRRGCGGRQRRPHRPGVAVLAAQQRQGLRARQADIRVLIATDVLSEGQNLQDAHVVVNFDLPWAIIRLIQRAGRVDRIGQNGARD